MIKRNEIGFSTVEVLIAIGILAVAVTFSLQLSGVFGSRAREADQSRLSSYYHSDLLARGKRLLTSVQDTRTPPSHTRALCSPTLIRTNFRTPGVGLIETNVNSSAANNVFNATAWSAQFGSDWAATACPADLSTAGAFMARCFSLNQNSTLRQVAAQGDKVTVQVRISPVNLDPTVSRQVFSTLGNSAGWIDAKKVAFQITSTVLIESQTGGTKDSKNKKKTTTNGMVWTAEVSHCDIGGVKAAVSGSGLGDFMGDTLYNTTNFDSSTVGPLMINVQKRVITEGQKLNYEGDDYMKANFDKNIEVACQESRYSCPGESARTYFPELSFRTNIRYFANNSVNSRVQSEFSLRPQIIREGSATDILANRRGDIAYTAAGQPFVERNSRMVQLDTDGNTTRRDFFVGGVLTRSQVDVRIGNMNPTCRTVCSDPSIKYRMNFMATLWNYNRNGSDYIENIPNQAKGDLPIQVGCNACYMRSCSRFGVYVFGPMSQQPPEPLDVGIPHCAVRNSEQRSKQVPEVAMPSVAADRCVSYRYSGGKAVLSIRNCDDQLPVICFSQGRFMPARSLSTPGEYQFPSVAYNAAQRLCYEQGHETGLRSDLVSMLRISYAAGSAALTRELGVLARMVPATQTRYEIFNASNQGIFIAPQSPVQWAQLNESQSNPKLAFIDPKYPEVAGTEYWIAYRTTNSGHPAPEVPLAQAGVSVKENFGIYYLANGRPKVTEFAMQAASDRIGSGPGVAVLVNHIKYRGLVFAPANSTVRRPALCRTKAVPHDFFVLTGVPSLAQAASGCENSNGVFAAPTTPLGWARAMQALVAATSSPSQNDPNYPFPLPATDGGTPLNPATMWVALEGDVSGTSVSSWRMPANHTVFNNIFDRSLLLAADASCNKYESDLTNYSTLLSSYEKALADYKAWEDGGKVGTAPRVPPKPAQPVEPTHKCPVDTTGSDERDYLGRFLPEQKSGKRANLILCENRGTGEWFEERSKTSCSADSTMIKASDLTRNYMNSTKWLLLRSRFSNTDVIYLQR